MLLQQGNLICLDGTARVGVVHADEDTGKGRAPLQKPQAQPQLPQPRGVIGIQRLVREAGGDGRAG